METRNYKVTITGASPLLIHACNVVEQDRLKKWMKDPNNKKTSTAGDDRSPAFTWLTYCYHNGKHLTMDVDNIMSMFRDAGTKCPAPTGRGSMKGMTQSGIIAEGLGWEIIVGGNKIPWEPLNALFNESDFEVHQEVASSLGIELFMKRATIGTQKHVRVRPKFNEWSLEGKIMVLDPQLTESNLKMILKQGGFYVGLGDWRPGGKTPGQFGRFSAEIKKI